MKNILLVDDHVIIRAGLKMFIECLIPHSVIDEAPDGNIAFEKIKQKDYDLLILDVNMPGTDSFGLVSNIMAVKPESKILMLSMNAEEIYAKKYLMLGAQGYIGKDAPEAEIKKAIETILNDKRYLSTSLSRSLTEEALGNKSFNPFDSLSPQEFKIIQYLMKGESVSEISEKLNLHTSTIGTHKARIFKKLNCKNIVDINSLAKIHNVIPPGI
ncbi:MAG: response regulator transcription factor [Bacteroidota bacterium]|nr:response regulator transcription factor [Bacteroidota bacterium]